MMIIKKQARVKTGMIQLLATIIFCLALGQRTQAQVEAPSLEALPVLLVITAANTGLIGGIGLTIDVKRSAYKDQLEQLELYLINKHGLRVRNMTDLLVAMNTLGFEYVDAFTASAGTLGVGGDVSDDVTVSGSQSKFRTNFIFKKKTLK